LRPAVRELAIRDLQDLMAYPFFSLGKSKRIAPIEFHAGDVSVEVEGTLEHGLATIWDADVLIWATSQLVEARDEGLPTSPRLVATPRDILTSIRRGTSVRDYLRLKAALDRLQSTTVLTSIRQVAGRRRQRFSWISEWKERSDRRERAVGLELTLPDWLYSGICDRSRVLTIDPTYFAISGGIERWLYRLARKHAGLQARGWRFDFPYLYRKSGSLARISDFAMDLRRIAARQSLPGYRLSIARSIGVESMVVQRVPSATRARHALQ
jgi:plasmid replication initiation protein